MSIYATRVLCVCVSWQFKPVRRLTVQSQQRAHKLGLLILRLCKIFLALTLRLTTPTKNYGITTNLGHVYEHGHIIQIHEHQRSMSTSGRLPPFHRPPAASSSQAGGGGGKEWPSGHASAGAGGATGGGRAPKADCFPARVGGHAANWSGAMELCHSGTRRQRQCQCQPGGWVPLHSTPASCLPPSHLHLQKRGTHAQRCCHLG